MQMSRPPKTTTSGKGKGLIDGGDGGMGARWNKKISWIASYRQARKQGSKEASKQAAA